MAMRLLLIDDNPDQIAIIKRILRSAESYLIDTAPDATKGLAKILRHSYDVILCDYRLPDLSGLELLKRLKPQGIDTPFILMTSAGSERIAVEALQEGASDYLVKDAAYEEMLAGVLRRAMERGQEKQQRKRVEAERDQIQAALQASYEQLKGLLQFKDELIAKVSHEFRTPLTSVNEGLALLLNQTLGPLTAEQREYLEIVHQDLGRLTELVELHQGRIEVASQPGHGTTFTVCFPVPSAGTMLAESFRELHESAGSEQQQTISFVALHVDTPVGTDSAVGGQRRQEVEDEARRAIHRYDILLDVEPSWIVILTMATPEGLQAMVTRLCDALKRYPEVRIGCALYPVHGTDAPALFEAAKRPLSVACAPPQAQSAPLHSLDTQGR